MQPYFDAAGASPGEVAGVGVAPDGRPFVDSSFPVLRGGVAGVELVDGRPVLTTEAGV